MQRDFLVCFEKEVYRRINERGKAERGKGMSAMTQHDWWPRFGDASDSPHSLSAGSDHCAYGSASCAGLAGGGEWPWRLRCSWLPRTLSSWPNLKGRAGPRPGRTGWRRAGGGGGGR